MRRSSAVLLIVLAFVPLASAADWDSGVAGEVAERIGETPFPLDHAATAADGTLDAADRRIGAIVALPKESASFGTEETGLGFETAPERPEGGRFTSHAMRLSPQLGAATALEVPSMAAFPAAGATSAPAPHSERSVAARESTSRAPPLEIEAPGKPLPASSDLHREAERPVEAEGLEISPVVRSASIALAVLAALALALLALGMFSRHNPETILRHALREKLLAHARANPGTNAASAGRATGASCKLALYHLRRLARFGLLVERERRFFAPDAQPLPPVESLRSAIARTVRERQVASLAEVSRALSISPQLAAYHLRQLVGEGTLGTERLEHRRLFHATPNRPPSS